jgi:CheY-like chemotaxis protein
MQAVDEVDVGILTQACLAMHRREREAGLSLELKCAPQLVIHSDRRLWLHVLMNLISNAVKFTMHEQRGAEQTATPEAPAVTVSIARWPNPQSGNMLRVEVSDTGPGIAPDAQAFIFGKFACASRGFRAQGLGSGLGLHLSAKIIQLLCGELELTSPIRDGRGARFQFTVPCTFASATNTSRRASMSAGGDGDGGGGGGAGGGSDGGGGGGLNVGSPSVDTGPSAASSASVRPISLAGLSAQLLNAGVPRELRVLIVEDDDLNYLVMASSLEVGFREMHDVTVHVQHARTAEAALAIIAAPRSDSDSSKFPFDVVIADQHMERAGGVMKGSELTAMLSAQRHGVHVPVLVIASGDDAVQHVDAVLEPYRALSGADVFWPKPYPRRRKLVRDIVSFLLRRNEEPAPPTSQRLSLLRRGNGNNKVLPGPST